jgi:hypothetical protein
MKDVLKAGLLIFLTMVMVGLGYVFGLLVGGLR